MPQHCVGTARQYLKRLRVPGKLVGIYEAAAYFVECVSRQMIIHIEFACQINGPGVGVNQAVYFLPGSLGACHRVCPGQSGEVLPEAVAGNESMKVLFGIEVVGIVVPSAHVRTGSRQSRTLAEGFQQGVLVQI